MRFNKKLNVGCSFPLSMAMPGNLVKIVAFRAGSSMQERLLSMGINVGDVIRVEQQQRKGPMLISKDGQKYGLGAGMAHKILTTKV